MINMAQRIRDLRTAKELSAAALSMKLGFAKNAVERFESGKQTPNKDQQWALANFFEVSAAYLRGETNDPTRQESWMDMALDVLNEPEPSPAPPPLKTAGTQQNMEEPLLSALLVSPAAQDILRRLIRDELKSAEGRAFLRNVLQDIQKNDAKRGQDANQGS